MLKVCRGKFKSIFILRIILGFSGVLSQQKLQELVREIDPKQVLDEDVEEVTEEAIWCR